MNETLRVLMERKSVRVFEKRPIGPEEKQAILNAAMRAPTAGNSMLYSILDVTDQALKDKLAITCDHQPFIAVGTHGAGIFGRLPPVGAEIPAGGL